MNDRAPDLRYENHGWWYEDGAWRYGTIDIPIITDERIPPGMIVFKPVDTHVGPLPRFEDPPRNLRQRLAHVWQVVRQFFVE